MRSPLFSNLFDDRKSWGSTFFGGHKVFFNFKDIINRFINLSGIEYSVDSWTMTGLWQLLQMVKKWIYCEINTP